MDDDGEQSAEEIHREILSLKTALERELGMPTRRDVLKVGSAAILGGGAMAVFGGSAAADHGNLGGNVASDSEPATHVFTEQVVYHERTSDPSSPQDGVSWYNSSA